MGKISKTGGAGRHKGNIERDCQTIIKTFGKRFGAIISTTPVRMWNPSKSCIEVKQLPLIYPDDFARALWKRSPKLFQNLLLADGNTRDYWEQCRKYCEWFREHPSYGWSNNWGKMVPLSLYGDDVQAYRNSEVGTMSIFAWSSDLAASNSFKSRYFLITAYSEHEECQYTFNDLMKAIATRITNMVTPSLSIKMEYPWLRDEYSFMLSSLQGDLKWVNNYYGNFFDYRSNAFCGYCQCVKKDATVGMTLADFSATALHTSTTRTYSQADLIQSYLEI